MILLIDNYDSFTYNLYQFMAMSDAEVHVSRNDKITISEILNMKPEGIVISPGPGRPEDSKVSVEVIEKLSGEIPILGVCLGHQAIGLVNGGKIVNAPSIMHGKTSPVSHNEKTIFENLPNPFIATRYHSLVISPENFPEDKLEITARTLDGVIMGVQHKFKKDVYGVQFHPESVMTESGMDLIKNFLHICKRR